MDYCDSRLAVSDILLPFLVWYPEKMHREDPSWQQRKKLKGRQPVNFYMKCLLVTTDGDKLRIYFWTTHHLCTFCI